MRRLPEWITVADWPGGQNGAIEAQAANRKTSRGRKRHFVWPMKSPTFRDARPSRIAGSSQSDRCCYFQRKPETPGCWSLKDNWPRRLLSREIHCPFISRIPTPTSAWPGRDATRLTGRCSCIPTARLAAFAASSVTQRVRSLNRSRRSLVEGACRKIIINSTSGIGRWTTP